MPKKTTSTPARVAGTIGYGLVLTLALLGGTAVGYIRQDALLGKLLHDKIFTPKPPQEVFGGKQSLTLLVLGCDEDRFFKGTLLHGSNVKKKYSRSDMILIAKLDFANNRITGVSLPRDTECKLPGFSKHKINAYHAIAKPGHEDELAERAIEYLLPGVDIERVIVLDFDAFQKLVDMTGGIDANVKKKMDYDDNAGELHIHLNPGPQHMNGYQAMGFVRFRHDGEGDFARQERQKQFLTAFKDSVWKSKFKILEIAQQSREVLNNALTDDEIASLIDFGTKVPSANIQMGMIPVIERPGSTFLKLDKEKLPIVLKQYNLLDGTHHPATSNP